MQDLPGRLIVTYEKGVRALLVREPGLPSMIPPSENCRTITYTDHYLHLWHMKIRSKPTDKKI